MDSPELARLANQWLLVDTSVWLRIDKYGDVLQKLLGSIASKYSCTLAVHNLIVQEFMSYTISQSVYNARLGYMNNFASLPIDKAIQETAIHITRLYAVNKITSPSIVDTVSAAMIKKYEGKLYFLTNDIKDFPFSLFNPFSIWPFDGDHGNEVFAFYEYNPNRYLKQEQKLVKATTA